MGRKKSEPIQLDPDKWYAIAHGPQPFLEECCDCGLVHRMRWKVEDGRIWFNYTRDERRTREARTRRRITAENAAAGIRSSGSA